MKEKNIICGEELSEVEVLKVQVRNREKAITFLTLELDKRPLFENEAVGKLKKTISKLQSENVKLTSENNRFLTLEKGERRELKKLIIVSNLIQKSKNLEEVNKKLKYDYDVLLQKYHFLKNEQVIAS